MKLNKKIEKIFELIASKLSIHAFYLRNHMKEYSMRLGRSLVILDIGSGKSPYKSLFRSEEYLRIDIIKYNGVDLLGDVCNLPLRPAVADLILSTEVLEHIMKPAKALKELARVLKPKKYLIITTPLLIGVHEENDFFRFTKKMLKLLLEKSGFKILELKERGGIFSTLGDILARIPFQIIKHDKRARAKKYLLFSMIFIYYILLFPFQRLLIKLDLLDKNKNFTLGYDIICQKLDGYNV